MRSWWRIAFAVLVALIPAVAWAASETPKPLFAGEDVIHVTIKGPVSTIVKNRVRSDDPVPAAITLVGDAPETLPISLSVRGLTRRKGGVCQFPPLRVEFPDKPPGASLFRGQKRLKLVTHCRDTPAFQQYVLMEYSAYRLANVLTPTSFRVRLATVDYVDADGRALTSRLGFFIEDTDDVAKRNGLREAETGDRVPLAQLSARDAARAAVFQYMVGNLDWAMTAGPVGSGCCHNTRLIGAQGATSGLIPMPYDFDFSGLVDAPYAVPPDSIVVSSVRVRQYRGYCLHNAEAQAAAAEFRAYRAALVAVFRDVPQLEEGRRNRAEAYLNAFFNDIATERDVRSNLLRTCLA